MKPILSIIIPTKNRYYYLESCLRSMTAQQNKPEIEIIITDNSTNKQQIEALKLFQNIKYSYFDKPISQVENFELALERVTGAYVTMIGDDDGLSNLLIDVVKYMDDNKIDALNANFVSQYWPNVVSKSAINDFSSNLFIDKYNFEIKKINSTSQRAKCLAFGGTSLCNMPNMYYGIIKKDILDKVKSDAGCYFPGPSPGNG